MKNRSEIIKNLWAYDMDGSQWLVWEGVEEWTDYMNLIFRMMNIKRKKMKGKKKMNLFDLGGSVLYTIDLQLNG
ncbi:hypothetical protein MTR_8g100020 [Medicago truncatula]|uniref:Uncharacterized protein n=1 Tax=Medicago truncatula TaxID=3880 RepID=G7LIS8_MEDTR|nr:hypothetical protein MTR_8g100020 [Medicago truncatula]